MSILIVGLQQQAAAVGRVVRPVAAGHTVSTVTKREELLKRLEKARLVFVGDSMTAVLLDAIDATRSRARVMVVAEQVRTEVLDLAVESSRIVGVSAAPGAMPTEWELSYVARRVLSPAEETPTVSDLLPWGATNIAWTPRTTGELHRIVSQIEGMARNLGCERHEASTISSAAHELLMNAMYDAPVGADGRPLYALDRRQELTLREEQAPTFRFTISAEYVGLDASDPFGRLPRERFFQGVLRGHRNMLGEGEPELDTSHGGAGLGLHTLYASGSVLRAELRPLQRTHVSWMLIRDRERARRARSLYFAPLVGRAP